MELRCEGRYPISTKSRNIPFQLGSGRFIHKNYPCDPLRSLPAGVPERQEFPGDPKQGIILGTQVTESESHQWSQRRKEPLFHDVGGPFFTQKRYVVGNIPTIRFVSQFPEGVTPPTWCRLITYEGPVCVYVSSPSSRFPPALDSSNEELNALGSTAIARVKPTTDFADISNFLGEWSLGGLPRLSVRTWESIVGGLRKGHNDAVRTAGKQAGDDYLNAQFGWKPFIRDLEDFTQGVLRATELIRQYERDAGKIVRRRYSFPTKTTVSMSTYDPGPGEFYMNPGGMTEVISTSNRLCDVERKLTQRQWFSGAFTYYLPTDYDSRKALDSLALKFEQVLGLSLTPETLWNLMPWSWAVDWFSNVGDVLSNVSDWANEGLVLRYGYLMEHTIVQDTYTSRSQRIRYSKAPIGTLTFVTETKKRVRANPFGFGVSWSGLSPYQLSIAAALGLSRS